MSWPCLPDLRPVESVHARVTPATHICAGRCGFCGTAKVAVYWCISALLCFTATQHDGALLPGREPFDYLHFGLVAG